MDGTNGLRDWLESTLAGYRFDVAGVARLDNEIAAWPVTFADAAALRGWLQESGRLQPLPKEPASLANILETSLVDFLEAQALSSGVEVFARGTERGYPDLEIQSPDFGSRPHAVDIKVARRKYTKTAPTTTQSRITLYTGNTYFKWPKLHWPGTFRPFDDYATHIDVVLLYTYDETADSRISIPEIVVHESWKIASKQRSSTTREYIGAIVNLEDLKNGRGEFDSAEAFYSFWRRYNFKISAQVAKQLEKLVNEQQRQLDQRDTT